MTRIENIIARRLIQTGLAIGYTVSVNDGEEWTVKCSAKEREILDALASTDSDTLRFRDKDGARVGDVLLIWGNEEDLISDHSDNDATDALLNRAGY